MIYLTGCFKSRAIRRLAVGAGAVGMNTGGIARMEPTRVVALLSCEALARHGDLRAWVSVFKDNEVGAIVTHTPEPWEERRWSIT